MPPKVFVLALGLTILALATATAPAEEAAFRVIVHPDNPTESLSKKQVSQLLLKEVGRWPHGAEVDPVDLDPKSAVREAFSREVHGRSVSSIKNYWQRQMASGKAVRPPPEFRNDADVIEFVKSHPGAIGYVSQQLELDSVRLMALRRNDETSE